MASGVIMMPGLIVLIRPPRLAHRTASAITRSELPAFVRRTHSARSGAFMRAQIGSSGARYGLHAGAASGVRILMGAPKSNRSVVIVCVEIGLVIAQWMRR